MPNGAVDTPTEIAIALQDEFGNALPDAKGQIAVSVSGANSVGSVGVDDLGGGSYRAVYTPTTAGTDQVSVTVAGQVVAGSPFTSTVAAGAADREPHDRERAQGGRAVQPDREPGPHHRAAPPMRTAIRWDTAGAR